MQRLRFSGFVLDLGRRELRSGDEVVHLSPKAFQLLELLVSAAPDGLSKERLYQSIWPDTFVDEANLPNLIKEIRKGLADDGREQKFIKTIHGFGYAFNQIPEDASASQQRFSSFVVRWGGRDYPLREGRNVIGREAGADVVIESAGVSRRHAAVIITGESASIEDLGSKNGTELDGRMIDGIVPLSPGTEIRLGSALLHLHHLGGTEATLTFQRS